MQRRDLIGLMMILTCALPGFAQDDSGPGFRQQAFPAWMSEPQTPAANSPGPGQIPLQAIAEPVDPADPDPRSGPPAPKGPGAGSRFRFTPPKMPDFSKFRSQCKTTAITQTGSGTRRLEETALSAVLPALASAAAALPGAVPGGVGTASLETPKADIPKRFYRPTGYSSFLQESRRAREAGDPEGVSATDTDQAGGQTGR
ncbi:MAG TPA: hypothetical protein VIV61_05330 [Candidatus Ozemobacteraceae bacterium]